MAADTYLDTSKLLSPDMRGDGFEPILTTTRSAETVPHLAKIHINIITHDEYVQDINLIISHERADAFSGEVHIGEWLEDEDFLSLVLPTGDESSMIRGLKLAHTPKGSELISDQKPRIMTGSTILSSRISEANDEFHTLVFKSGVDILKENLPISRIGEVFTS